VSVARRVDLDALRVIAAFGVIWIHICAFLEPAGWLWALAITCFRWVVPVFLMITGAVLALHDEQSSGVWLTRVLRMIAITAVSVALYTFVAVFFTHEIESMGFLGALLGGPPFMHLWYLYIAIAVYASAPLLLLIVRRVPVWMICIGLVVIYLGCALALRPEVPAAMMIFPLLGWGGYFVIGALLQKFPRPKHMEAISLVALLFIAIAGDIWLGFALEPAWGSAAHDYAIQFNSPFVAVTAGCVFRLAAFLPWQNTLARLAPATLGIYVVHPLWVLVLIQWNMLPRPLTALIQIPLLTALVFGLTALLVLTVRLAWLKMRSQWIFGAKVNRIGSG